MSVWHLILLWGGGGGFEAEQESAFYLSKYERLVIQIDCDESIYRPLPACRPKLR